MSKTKSERGKNIRNLIIETAMELISINGVDKTTLAKISEKAKISKGTLYYYYTTKNELIFDIADIHMDKITGDIFSMIDESKSGITWQELLTLFFNSLLSSTTRSKLHLYLIKEAITDNNDLKNRFHKTYLLWFAMVDTAYEKMANTDPEVKIKARFLIAVIDGFIIQTLLLPLEKIKIDDIVKQMLKVIGKK